MRCWYGIYNGFLNRAGVITQSRSFLPNNPPIFSLAFLGIGNLSGSIGMCLWWLPCVAESLLFILRAAAPGAASLSPTEKTSSASPSCKLLKQPSSGAALILLGLTAPYSLRKQLSSIADDASPRHKHNLLPASRFQPGMMPSRCANSAEQRITPKRAHWHVRPESSSSLRVKLQPVS